MRLSLMKVPLLPLVISLIELPREVEELKLQLRRTKALVLRLKTGKEF